MDAADAEDTVDIIGSAVYESGIEVNKSLTLRGQGRDVTLVQADAGPGAATDRVFNLTGGSAVLENLTVRHGYPPTDQDGGGIRIAGAASVTLDHCMVSNNEAPGDATHGYGGGIACISATDLSVRDGMILANTARLEGGRALSSRRRTFRDP